MSEIILEVKDLSKSYSNQRRQVHVLEGISLSAQRGKFYVVKGDSGSGKSTLLSIMGGLQKPDEGSVMYRSTDLSSLEDESLARLRRHDIVYISQFQDVIPELTVSENISIVDCFEEGEKDGEKPDREKILRLLGLEDLADERPENLSGGELRRLTIARAVYADPTVLLLDEPTNDLDAANREIVISLLKLLSGQGITIIAATHDDTLADAADTVFVLDSSRRLTA